MKYVLNFFLLLAIFGCKSTIYGTWQLQKVQMENLDSATTNLLIDRGVFYRFYRNGTYTYAMDATHQGEGVFEILGTKESNQLKTIENEISDSCNFEVSKTELLLIDSGEIMQFKRIKKQKWKFPFR